MKMKSWLYSIFLVLIFYSLDANAEPEFDSATQIKEDSAFSFVVWGHPRGASDGDPPLYFDEVLNRISDLKPDLLIITGDIISGGASRSKPLNPDLILSDWKYFDSRIEKLGIPVYRTPGNHDVNNFTTRDIYLERYRKPPYAITYKGSRFIFLDSIGIDQRKNDNSRYWYYLGLPFDEAQINFVIKEIADQDNYDHLFFFWHHTRFWSEPTSIWWKKIHPLLINGRTRAIFTGDPIKKYLYENHDNIHYIASAFYETHDINYFVRRPENRSGWDICRQLDNIQYVKVKNDSVSIQPIVIGSKHNKGLSPRFWMEIENALNWRQRVVNKVNNYLKRPRQLFILSVGWGAIWWCIGVLITIWWFHRKNKRLRKQS